MGKHKNKLALVLCALIAISCDKKEDEKLLSQPITAAEFYQYNYWVIGAGFNYAESYIRTNNEKLRQTNDSCAISIADKLDREIAESKKALEESQQNAIAVITRNVTEDELLRANEYFKTTSIGKYLASQAGTMEMGRVLRNSQYSEDIAMQTEDPGLSQDDRMEIAIGYMLKLLPANETISYTTFRNLTVWQSLEMVRDQLETAMKPYTDNSGDIAKLNEELKNCPSMVSAAQKATSLEAVQTTEQN